MTIKDPKGVCESLLSIDPGIIYVSIHSITGEVIGSAARPSASVMISSSGELTNHFRAVSSMLAAYTTSKSGQRQAERFFGEFKDMVVTFANFNVIIILNDAEQIIIAFVTLKDVDAKKITFQSSKIISG